MLEYNCIALRKAELRCFGCRSDVQSFKRTYLDKPVEFLAKGIVVFRQFRQIFRTVVTLLLWNFLLQLRLHSWLLLYLLRHGSKLTLFVRIDCFLFVECCAIGSSILIRGLPQRYGSLMVTRKISKESLQNAISDFYFAIAGLFFPNFQISLGIRFVRKTD